MNADSNGDRSRLSREREIWNDSTILEAQNFKSRFMAGFLNPHIQKRERKRSALIREKCQGAVVLDYGCFEGAETQSYLDHGAARVFGVDIADEAIGRARARITDPRASFHAADAHALPFDSETIDLIVGRAILHHLDLDRAYRELARLLKPGGIATFVEPLKGNPGAKIVRLFTPKARTPDERPLDMADIRKGNRLIGPGVHEFTGVVSTPVGMLVSLLGGSDGNPLLRLASACDDLLEHTPLRYWGRVVFLYWQKPR